MCTVRRPHGRLFYFAVFLLAIAAAALASYAEAQGPQKTEIADVVYRPDGTPAQGTVLISCLVWIVNHWLTPPNQAGK